VGRTAPEQTRWLLDLATAREPLDETPSLERLWELRAFVDAGKAGPLHLLLRPLEEELAVDYRDLIRAAITDLTDARGWIYRDTVRFTLGDTLDLEEVTGTDALRRRIAETLQQTGARLRRCPGCRKVFVRNRRQERCSKKCGWRARTRKSRAAKRGGSSRNPEARPRTVVQSPD